MQLPSVQEKFIANGYSADFNTPSEFSQLIKDELVKWKQVVKTSGVHPE